MDSRHVKEMTKFVFFRGLITGLLLGSVTGIIIQMMFH